MKSFIQRRTTAHSALRAAVFAALGALFFFGGCGLLNKSVKKEQQSGSVFTVKPKVAPQNVYYDSTGQMVKNVLAEIPPVDTTGGFAESDALVILACNNYIEMFPKSPKSMDVLQIKASTFYNAKRYTQARETYQTLLEKHEDSYYAPEALRMVAQSFYEEKKFDEAEKWYRKLKDLASASGMDTGEALARLSESIYRTAEKMEQDGKLRLAAKEFERIAIEFPEAKIADVALLNAGLIYEKMTEWSSAILVFTRLTNQFESSKYRPRAFFRMGKCYEKLNDWEKAATAYLDLVKTYPSDPLSPDAIYTAGFCFENGENWPAAAKTFEKTAELYPKSKDAANVLFRAGEIYLRIADWENVSRINKIFAKNFGDDRDRVVQALCMAGIAARMQKRPDEALEKLNSAIIAFQKLGTKSAINTYYAAKSQFTLGEIFHERMKEVVLAQPASVYEKRLGEKTKFLEQAIRHYTETAKYKVDEWTTQAVFNSGQGFEDFATDLFKQDRPREMTLDQRLSLETGIARAVVEYLIRNALPNYENNVKLGIKLNLKDRWVVKSRDKLTMLPYFAGSNYTQLMSIMEKNQRNDPDMAPMARMAKKLENLQRIAPLQEEAIALFLKSIEMGVMYQIQDDFVKKSTAEVTIISFKVGELYREIVEIARGAPIPGGLSPYEEYLYKVKLVQSGIAEYENRALEAYLKIVGIANAYKLEDPWVDSSKVRIGQMLFTRARCFDVLALEGLKNPPVPPDAGEEEKDLYRAQFEELGFKLQDQAVELYQDILDKKKKGVALGEAVSHAYMRLFQIDSKQNGSRVTEEVQRSLESGPNWKCTALPPADTLAWRTPSFDASQWTGVRKGVLPDSPAVTGFKGKMPMPMWGETGPEPFQTPQGISLAYTPARRLWFRTGFSISSLPMEAILEFTAVNRVRVYINSKRVVLDSVQQAQPWNQVKRMEVRSYIRPGPNLLSAEAENTLGTGFGVLLRLNYPEMADRFVALLPGQEKPLSEEEVKQYVFPEIPNFKLVSALPPAPAAAVPAPADSSRAAPPRTGRHNTSGKTLRRKRI